ncbi:MAG TPA: DUF4159 domain-containing protein [Longimicrobiales bacterium]
MRPRQPGPPGRVGVRRGAAPTRGGVERAALAPFARPAPFLRLAPWAWLALLLAAAAACAQTSPPTIEAGRAALRAGRYDEAIAIFRALAKRAAPPAPAAANERAPAAERARPAGRGAPGGAASVAPAVAARRALVHALLEVGRYDEAESVAREGAAATPELAATLGEVLVRRGKRAEAERAFRRAVEASASDRLTAELRLGELLYDRGERDAARRIFDRFIDVYNRAAPGALSAADLVAIGDAVRRLGADDPALFHDALRAYDEAAAADSAALEPRLLAAELFLEKYNSADARTGFREVLAANPRHPRALVGLARVMEFDGEPGAGDVARQALETNPGYVPAHVLLARLRLAAEDFDGAAREAERALAVDPTSLEALAVLAGARRLAGDRAGFEAVVARADSLYPRSAELLATVADLAARNRDYRGAVALAARALERDSSSAHARGVRGINRLRTGELAGGRADLEAAFRADPYNVWYKNTLDLLDALAGYEERQTEHFRLVLHPDEAGLLAPFAGALAEEAYAALAARYGYAPDGPIRIELFPRHADFSVRTVGLVGMGALGVAFGDVLAMDSPAARERGTYNWGATLWHETVHAFHLGMTGNRLPRWLAEGLAVREERRARPGWGADPDLSFLAALDAGRLVPASRLNDAIVRPSYPEQVAHGYYQASLVVEWIEAEYGFPAVLALLRAYARGAGTDAALRHALGLEREAFDAAFDRWLRRRFAEPLAALRGAGGLPALLERARARLDAGDADAAIADLERAVAIAPDLAGPDGPWALLARARLARGDTAGAAVALERHAAVDENAYDALLALAGLRERLGDPRGAATALERALWIDPYDPALHDRLAGLYAAAGDAAGAVRARRAILALDPVDRAAAHYRLALALRDAGDYAAARREVLRALEIAPAFAEAQELLLELTPGRREPQENTPYDGRFTFARIRYVPAARGFRGFGWGRGGNDPPWAHDFPRAERNLMKILDEITAIEPFLDGGNIFDADDPELLRYPVAYVSEPGYWNPTDREVEALRTYLLKGGFLIFDDFGGRDWYNFERQIRRVLPGLDIVQLDASHPIFHSFFDIESLDIVRGYRGRPVFLGIFEDNDPERRLLAIINYNADIGDYWEWSDAGFVPIDLSNEAYKLGVNYIVYALTH